MRFILGSLYLFLFLGCAAGFEFGGVNCRAPLSGQFQKGSGTLADPYVICSAEQIVLIDSNDSYLNQSYILAADIDFNTSLGNIFAPVGFHDGTATSRPFTGRFDGKGRTISGINLTTSTSSTGLFAHTNGAIIRNLKIEDSSIILNSSRIGLVVGHAINTSFENIEVSGSIEAPPTNTTSNNYVGGVIGSVVFQDVVTIPGFEPLNSQNNSYRFFNVVNNASVHAVDQFGGVFGRLDILGTSITVEMRNVRNYGNLLQTRGGNSAGGIGGFFGRGSSPPPSSGSFANIILNNVKNISSINVPVDAGSWVGGIFGTFVVGIDSRLTAVDVGSEGSLRTQADFPIAGNRCCVGGTFGNFALHDRSITSLKKIYSHSNITILTNAGTDNFSIGGLIGSISQDANSVMDIEQCYVDAELNFETTNVIRGAAGLIGRVTQNAGTELRVAGCYARTSAQFMNATLDAHTVHPVVGEYFAPVVGLRQYSSIFYNQSTHLVSPDGFPVPAGDLNVNDLTDSQMLLRSSYVGPLWNFASVWRIQENVNPPRLR